MEEIPDQSSRETKKVLSPEEEKNSPDGEELSRPGVGLPWGYICPSKERLPNFVADGYYATAVTVRELRMLAFINQITDKPSWETKIHDETIVARWKAEASKEIAIRDQTDVILSNKMFDYVRIPVQKGLHIPMTCNLTPSSAWQSFGTRPKHSNQLGEYMFSTPIVMEMS